ncbi:hypothetical protein LZ554_006133 [Drepanopeziza brunnea f. sp. 'monogermtubi']|nr:hypothetical protein LZ554_006133 [Drepanopeziza brunnea f. sp. 'monogermtubi']
MASGHQGTLACTWELVGVPLRLYVHTGAIEIQVSRVFHILIPFAPSPFPSLGGIPISQKDFGAERTAFPVNFVAA